VLQPYLVPQHVEPDVSLEVQVRLPYEHDAVAGEPGAPEKSLVTGPKQ
jgi:hypothetical protein